MSKLIKELEALYLYSITYTDGEMNNHSLYLDEAVQFTLEQDDDFIWFHWWIVDDADGMVDECTIEVELETAVELAARDAGVHVEMNQVSGIRVAA